MPAGPTNVHLFVDSSRKLDTSPLPSLITNTEFLIFLNQYLEAERQQLLTEINCSQQANYAYLLSNFWQSFVGKSNEAMLNPQSAILLNDLAITITALSTEITQLEQLIQDQEARIHEIRMKLISYGFIAIAIVGYAFCPWLAAVWISIISIACLFDLCRRLAANPWCIEKWQQLKNADFQAWCHTQQQKINIIIFHMFFFIISSGEKIINGIKNIPDLFVNFPQNFKTWIENGIKDFINFLGIIKAKVRLLKQVPRYVISTLAVSENLKEGLMTIPCLDFIVNVIITGLDFLQIYADKQVLKDKLIDVTFNLIFIASKAIRFIGLILNYSQALWVKVAGCVGLGLAAIRSSWQIGSLIAERQNNMDLLEEKCDLLNKIIALNEIEQSQETLKKIINSNCKDKLPKDDKPDNPAISISTFDNSLNSTAKSSITDRYRFFSNLANGDSDNAATPLVMTM